MNIKAVRSAFLFAISTFIFSLTSVAHAAIPVTVNGQVCSGASVTFSSAGNTVDVTIPAGGCGATGTLSVSAVTPNTGSPGTPVTITGSGFVGTASVTIGGVAATEVRVVNSSTITAVVSGSAAAGTAPIAVAFGATSAPTPPSYTVTARLVNTPYISNVTPPGKKAGETINISGFNFVAGTTVTLGGVAATVSNITATQVDIVIPASLTAGGALLPLVLTVPNAATNGLTANYFAYTVEPTVVSSSCPAGEDCTIAAPTVPIPKPSKAPGVIGTPGPATPFPVGTFYSVDPASRCAGATPAISRLWQQNIDFVAYQNNGAVDYVFLQAGDALTYRFVAPAIDTRQLISYNTTPFVVYRPGFISVSTRPCDFDSVKVAANNQCYKTGPAAGAVNLQYATFANADTRFECKLTPGATYYVNIRMQDASPVAQGGNPTIDACDTGTFCGGILQVR
jgi:IPT/TIG domain